MDTDTQYQASPTATVELTRTLTTDEDNFALAVIEYGGNLRAAYVSVYGEHSHATGKAKALIARPEVSARIRELNGAVLDSHLISMESHLIELANIRDMAKTIGSLKVALSAEEARGKVAGFYVSKIEVGGSISITEALAAANSRLVEADVTDVTARAA